MNISKVSSNYNSTASFAGIRKKTKTQPEHKTYSDTELMQKLLMQAEYQKANINIRQRINEIINANPQLKEELTQESRQIKIQASDIPGEEAEQMQQEAEAAYMSATQTASDVTTKITSAIESESPSIEEKYGQHYFKEQTEKDTYRETRFDIDGDEIILKTITTTNPDKSEDIIHFKDNKIEDICISAKQPKNAFPPEINTARIYEYSPEGKLTKLTTNSKYVCHGDSPWSEAETIYIFDNQNLKKKNEGYYYRFPCTSYDKEYEFNPDSKELKTYTEGRKRFAYFNTMEIPKRYTYNDDGTTTIWTNTNLDRTGKLSQEHNWTV